MTPISLHVCKSLKYMAYVHSNLILRLCASDNVEFHYSVASKRLTFPLGELLWRNGSSTMALEPPTEALLLHLNTLIVKIMLVKFMRLLVSNLKASNTTGNYCSLYNMLFFLLCLLRCAFICHRSQGCKR